ncbi:dockerin type I domain-containing protein [Aeoliella sp. SH292]|uniref:dockerin type I domain-containing protein n=1 Tax=Aeoliella sp. SH292 TaxID=3454464 RepID=UPI003F95BE4F
MATFLLVGQFGNITIGQTLPSGIINAPPTTIGNNQSIGSNTTLNVRNSGAVGINFRAGLDSGSSTNVVVNIEGGSLGGGFWANRGSRVNLRGGTTSSVYVSDGAVFNVSGGQTGHVNLLVGAVLNLTGGQISALSAQQSPFAPYHPQINIYGGGIGDTDLQAGMRFFGGEFRLNGVEIGGGTIAIDGLSLLSGTLQDGRVFAISGYDVEIPLVETVIPAINPTPTVVDQGTVHLEQLRTGESVVLRDGGMIDGYVTAIGSSLLVEGGEFRGNCLLIDSELVVQQGSVDFAWASHGSVITLAGGRVRRATSDEGGVINVAGGSLPQGVYAYSEGIVNISGGVVGHSNLLKDSVLNLSGGYVSGLAAWDTSVVNISGGSVGDGFEAYPGSIINLFGDSFAINGVPVQSLSLGEPFQVTQRDVTLSGILADGTPVSFELNSSGSSQDHFFSASAVVTITRVEVTRLPGDFNSDGQVNLADYTVWRDSLGQTGAGLAADGNGDSVVDARDYAEWKENFGRSSASSASFEASKVPEPRSMAIACLLVAMVGISSRVRTIRSADNNRA